MIFARRKDGKKLQAHPQMFPSCEMLRYDSSNYLMSSMLISLV
jgi:hypothetical protein